MKGIKFIAPFFDHSGYGQAAIGYVLSLKKMGIPLTLFPVSFENRSSFDHSLPFYEDLNPLILKPIEYDVVMICLTPNNWVNNVESGSINIGLCVWETSKIPDDWATYINSSVDAVVLPSEFCVNVFKKSGIQIPIINIPYAKNIFDHNDIKPCEIKGLTDDKYAFYSIIDFIDRKNPFGLLKAYWCEFTDTTDVALILKATLNGKQDFNIKNTIKRYKSEIRLGKYPPVYLLEELSRSEIISLHKRGDCLVSLDRGEGFGLVPFEAGQLGKPIIVTKYGGVTQYANDDNSYLIDYNLTPISGFMANFHYNATQLWAEPNCCQAMGLMRHVYNNRKEAIEKGKKLKKTIDDKFSLEYIGNLFIDELENFKK